MSDLLITDVARRKMHYACNFDKSKEVSWFAKQHLEGESVVIDDIWIPPQTVGGAHIDITTDDMAAFWTDLVSRGENVQDWNVWCHSHAGMSTGPSSVDEKTLEMLSRQYGTWVIALVTNYKGDYTAWLGVTKPWYLVDKSVSVSPVWVDDENVKAEIHELMKANVEVEKPAATYQHPFRGGVPSTNQAHGRAGAAAAGAANNRPGDIRYIRKSVEYPGNVEIMRNDGTFIVTKDCGQAEAWASYAKLSKNKTKKAEHAADKALAKHRGAGSSRWQQPVETLPVNAPLVGSPEHIGFDIDGTPLRKGEHADLAYNTIGQPLYPELGILPLNMAMYPKAVAGAGSANYESLSPTQIAEMLHLAPGVNELEDGTIIDDGRVISKHDLRGKYLVPSDVHDDDVVEFVAMMQAGANPMALIGGIREEIEAELAVAKGLN